METGWRNELLGFQKQIKAELTKAVFGRSLVVCQGMKNLEWQKGESE